jgi:hypothetical protein
MPLIILMNGVLNCGMLRNHIVLGLTHENWHTKSNQNQ